MEKKFLIYCVYNNVTHKVYIGKTCQLLNKRWGTHKHFANKGYNTYFYNSIRKHKAKSFDIWVLAETDTDEKASQLERIWILLLRSYDHNHGYNSTYGGEGFGSGDKNPNWKSGKSGINNPSYGKPIPPERRRKSAEV